MTPFIMLMHEGYLGYVSQREAFSAVAKANLITHVFFALSWGLKKLGA